MAITKLQSSRDFFRIWFFWKKQAVFIFLLIVALVMFYAYTATPRYESTAKILVLPKTNEGEVISSGVDEKKVLAITEKDIYTEIELLQSPSVLKNTVTAFGDEGLNLSKREKSIPEKITAPIKMIFNKALSFLRLTQGDTTELESQILLLSRSLLIEPILDSDIISVSLQAEKPERTTLVLEKLLNQYLKHRNNVYTKEEGLSFYDQQAVKYKFKLDQAENKLKEFQKKGSIVDLQIQNQANIDLLTKLNNELKMLEIDYEEGINKIVSLKENIIKDPSRLYLTKEMRNIPAIVELEKNIVPVLIKRSEISKTFTQESREYQAINSQVAMLRDEIRYEIEKAIRTDSLELESMKTKVDSLTDKIDFLKNEASEFHQNEKMHKELERQVRLYRDSYLLYSKKTEDAKMHSIKNEQNLANVSISSMPTTPHRPFFPNRILLLLLSIFAGAFAALFTPFIIESIDTKLKTTDDVEKLIGVPVISSFSLVRK